MAISNTSQYLSTVRSITSSSIGTRKINPNKGSGLYSKSGDIRDDELMRNEGKTRYGIDSSSLVSKDEDINIIGNMGGTPMIGQSTSLYMNENNHTEFLDDQGGLNGFTNNQDETESEERIVKGAKFRNEVFNNNEYIAGASFFAAPDEYETYSVNDERESKMADESINRVDYRPYTKGSLSYSDDNEDLVAPSNYSDNRAVHYTHYDEKNVASKKETHVLDEFDSFDFNDSIENSNLLISDGSSTLVKRTNNLFKQGKIGSLISRFSTGADFKGNEEPTSKTGYGMSRGRNLLKTTPTQHNGYTNPYCRVWTAHYQYSKYTDLIRPFNQDNANTIEKLQSSYNGFRPERDKDGELRGNEYLNDNTTLLPETNLPLIAPTGNTSDDIRKCMFSIENLAWKGNTNDGKLEDSQKGPFGGRIMWFPPYNLSFDENVSVNWQPNEFIGRGEKIYTYANTERSGTLKFSILVDHPSVIDMFMADGDVMADERENEQKLLRFFAGCEPIEISEEIVSSHTFSDGKTTIPKKEVPSEDTITVCFPIFYPNNYSAVDYQERTKEQTQCHSSGETGSVKTWTHRPQSKTFNNNARTILNGVAYIYDTYEQKLSDVKEIGKPFTDGKEYTQDYKWSDQILETDGERREYQNNSNYGLNTLLFSQWINEYNMSDTGITSWCNPDYSEDIKSAFKDAVDIIGLTAGTKVVSLQELYEHINSKQDLFNFLTSGDTQTLNADNYTVSEIKAFGGASSHGQEEWNKVLCTDRWNTIFDYLIQKGVLTSEDRSNSFNSDVDTKISLVENTTIPDFIGTYGAVSLPTAKAGRSASLVIKFKPNKTETPSDDSTTKTIVNETESCESIKNTARTTVKCSSNITTTDSTGTSIYTAVSTYVESQKEKFMPQNEYVFFKNLEKNDSVAYKSLIRKLKYFNPAFHSITPEGFNSRLTFLHQCTRQGPTYSTSSDNKGSAERAAIGAGNLAFGEAPYCILRIGDFYYTKIVIDSITITYDTDGLHWDMNPEGIGMQPMMADINISFKFMGGSDLAGPISKLQNAVTANYYANTSVYDKNSDRYDAELDNKGNYKY